MRASSDCGVWTAFLQLMLPSLPIKSDPQALKILNAYISFYTQKAQKEGKNISGADYFMEKGGYIAAKHFPAKSLAGIYKSIISGVITRWKQTPPNKK